MSATAIALQILEERGQLQETYGQRAFAVLLFQDMAVVPLLALLPLLAPFQANDGRSLAEAATATLIGAGAIAAIVLAGRYLLNPFLRALAATGTREAMTAGALLVVLGAALAMKAAGLSMALGAFLAGVMLAESTYRHELEADIEPFRGLLLAVFFMGVGMSIDLAVVRENLLLLLAAAVVVMPVKAAIVGALFRPTCEERADALRAGAVLTPAGEFAFVLFPLGLSLGLLNASQASLLAALAALTMLFGPPLAALSERLIKRLYRGGRARARRLLRRPRLGADHRLRPLRPDGLAILPGAGRGRDHHRRRRRDDPERRAVSASRSITATAPASTCCAPPAPAARA